MRIDRVAAVAVFGLVTVLGVAACGGGGRETASSPNIQNQKPADLDAPAAGGPGTGGGAAPAKDQAGGQPVPASERKVVRSAQLSLEVNDIYAAAREVYGIGSRYGGFVADEKTSDSGASIELKVAAKDLDAALSALSELGTRVISRGQQAQDVTEQVVDVQARVASQRASVERVRALLDNATGIGEIVQIESELTRRQADLESLERRAAALDAQTELATVSVQLSKPGSGTIAGGDDAGFLDGLSAGWRVFLASAQVLLTILGALLPFLIALAIPTALIVWLLRRRRPAAATAPSSSGGS